MTAQSTRDIYDSELIAGRYPRCTWMGERNTTTIQKETVS
jgi:hypothetical protein